MTALKLFLGAADVAAVERAVEHVRTLVRRAQRYTTKAESRAGQDANHALHDAEKEIERALKALRG